MCVDGSNVPLNYFFPEAILSTLRGYKAYQFENGQPPWVFGGCTAGNPQAKGCYDVATPDPVRPSCHAFRPHCGLWTLDSGQHRALNYHIGPQRVRYYSDW